MAEKKQEQKQQEVIVLDKMMWQYLTDYVVKIQPPYALIDSAYAAKQAIQSARTATVNIPEDKKDSTGDDKKEEGTN